MNSVQAVASAKAADVATTTPRAGPLARGTVSGLLGGAAMAAFLVGAAAAAGMDPLQPVRAIGTTFAGPEALRGGAGIVAWGLLLHAATSAAFGLLFVGLFPVDQSPLGAAVLGAGYAMFVLGLMAAGVVPVASPAFRPAVQPLGGTWVVAHALFGCVLGLAAARPGSRRSGAGVPAGDRTRGA